MVMKNVSDIDFIDKWNNIMDNLIVIEETLKSIKCELYRCLQEK